jgi:hypothetical protein
MLTDGLGFLEVFAEPFVTIVKLDGYELKEKQRHDYPESIG